MNATETNALILDAMLSMSAAVNAVERNEENAVLIDAAKIRMVEFRALVTMANGQPWPFRKELQSLTSELNEVIMTIERRLGAEIAVDDKDEINIQMAIREDGLFRIDASRINSVLALVHLSAALDASTPQPATLKAV